MTTATFWDGAAEKYAAQPVADTAAFDRKKAFTRKHLSPSSNVLEIGCGTGSLALAMAKDAGHIHAVDISAEMVRIARNKKERAGASNVTFHCSTLDEVRLPPLSFDVVWAYSILHLVDDRQAILDRCFTLLKPGGVLISSNVCLGDSWVPYRPVIAILRWLEKAPRVHFYGRDRISEELRRTGFVRVEEIDVGAKKLVAFMIAHKP